jgi:hypothetical protein
MPASAKPWTAAWSGGAWRQQPSGQWRQQASGGAAAIGSASGGGGDWQQSAAGWWSLRKPRNSASRASKWVGQWEPLAPPQSSWQSSWSYWRQQPQPSTAEPKAKAAADAVLIEELLAKLNDDPLFDSYRDCLKKDLEKTRKQSIDKRTNTQRLLQAEQWLAREQKRMAAEKTKLSELEKWIGETQERIDKEIGTIAELKAKVGAEPEEADMDMPSAQTELGRMEAKELALRRKRGGANLTEAERAAIDQQADQLAEQVGQKRRKIDEETAAAYA